jgi:hypothetical protein
MRITLDSFENGTCYLALDKRSVLNLTKNGNKRIICRINGSAPIHCAILKTAEGIFYIRIGANICKRLRLKPGQDLDAAFMMDTSAYQFEMPEELSAVFDSDKEAHTVFKKLTPGNQRSIIQLVLMVKSTDVRISRALTIAQKIKSGITSAPLIMKK